MNKSAKFTRGSTFLHTVKLTIANGVSLFTVFLVELVDMYFLSSYDNPKLVAAVGFSGTLLFYLSAFGLGMQITMSVLVARAEGEYQQDRHRAGQICTHMLAFSALVALLVAVPVRIYLPEIFELMGATGDTKKYAIQYTSIIIPWFPLFVLSMTAGASLRAIGHAKLAMCAALFSGGLNVIFDSIFILGFDGGIQGAAWSSVIARLFLFFFIWYLLLRKYSLPKASNFSYFKKDVRSILSVAIPGVITNMSAPLSTSIVLIYIADFGDDAVAGVSVLGRCIPALFAVVIALSGAVGPIVGQNAGANKYDRVRKTLIDAVVCNAVYVFLAWLLLFNSKSLLVDIFGVQGEAADIIYFYSTFLVGGFLFNGMIFISISCFNNLGMAYMSSFFSFSQSILGTLPCVYFGALWFGLEGVLIGEVIGAMLFGVTALVTILHFIQRQALNSLAVPVK